LRDVIVRKTEGSQTTIHFADHTPELETDIQIGAAAMLSFGSEPVKGRVIHFCRNEDKGFEVTIETES